MIKKIINGKVFSLDLSNKSISESILIKSNKKYKIGIIIDSPISIPPTTGVTYRLYNLSKKLSELGYEQVWFVGNRNHNDINSINLLKNEYIKIHILPSEFLYNHSYMSNIISIEKIDILQFEFSETFLALATELKRLNKIPIVLETHDVEATLRESLGKSGEVDLMKFIQYAACELADSVIAMTPNDHKELVSLIGISREKIFLAPNGINEDNNTNKINTENQTLIFLGNMYYFPNQEGLIHVIENVLPIVLKKNQDVVLKVIGMVPESIRTRYESKNVIFTGEILNDSEFKKQIRSGTIGLCILFSGSGMKVKILDYCINSLPIILTKTGISGYEKNDSFIVVKEDADSIANSIIDLLSDKNKIIDLGLKNHKFIIENFSWEKISEEMINAYDLAYSSYHKSNNIIELPKPFWFREGRNKEIQNKKHFVIEKDDIKEFNDI